MTWWMDLRDAGEDQAIRRAGSWPRFGTLAECRAATDRAVRAAHRVASLDYRWNRRFRLWERPADDVIEDHAYRLKARRRKAIEIAEEREWLLHRLDRTEGAA